MFSFLRKQRKDEQVRLVCLVTGYAVTGAVVTSFNKPGAIDRPVVLFSTETVLRFPEPLGNGILAHTVQDALKQVITRCKKAVPHYDELHCVLGEPWIISSTRTAHLEKKEPFVVSKKLIEDLVTRETKLFEQEMAREQLYRDEYGLLATAAPRVDLNGYPVQAHHYTESRSVMARVVDVHCTYTIAPTLIIERITEVFVDMFHRTDVVFHSFDHAKRYLLDTYEHGVICELGGTTIPCMIMRGGTPTHFAVIPTGLQYFEQSLMDLFAVSRSRITTVFSFIRDENILKHERDVYHNRIQSAYRVFASAIPFHVSQIKKYTQEFREPVVVIGRPEWIGHLKLMLSTDLHQSVIIPSQDTLSDGLVMTHGAETVSLPLTLAIIHVLSYEAK